MRQRSRAHFNSIKLFITRTLLHDNFAVRKGEEIELTFRIEKTWNAQFIMRHIKSAIQIIDVFVRY